MYSTSSLGHDKFISCFLDPADLILGIAGKKLINGCGQMYVHANKTAESS